MPKLRKIGEAATAPGIKPSCVAKVYRDAENNEYVVKFYVDEIHQAYADYFTDDKQDAANSADRWIEGN